MRLLTVLKPTFMNNNKLQEYDLLLNLMTVHWLTCHWIKVVTLSPSECLLLKHLMDNCSQTLGREFFNVHCWLGALLLIALLNVAIKNVRTALKEVGSDCKSDYGTKGSATFLLLLRIVPPPDSLLHLIPLLHLRALSHLIAVSYLKAL